MAVGLGTRRVFEPQAQLSPVRVHIWILFWGSEHTRPCEKPAVQLPRSLEGKMRPSVASHSHSLKEAADLPPPQVLLGPRPFLGMVGTNHGKNDELEAGPMPANGTGPLSSHFSEAQCCSDRSRELKTNCLTFNQFHIFGPLCVVS